VNKKPLLAALCFLLLAVSGCDTPVGSKPTETNNETPVDNKTPAVTSVTVSPKAATVAKGGAQTFAVEVAGTNDPAQTVTWTVSGNNAAETAFTGNVLTVAVGETATTFAVTAASTVDPDKSDMATLWMRPRLQRSTSGRHPPPEGTQRVLV
jgi:hypothetical protein